MDPLQSCSTTAVEHEVVQRGEGIALKLKLKVEYDVDYLMHESFLFEFMSSFVISLTVLTMGCKCLFEIRGESACSESVARLTKLSECKNNIDDQLQRWHLSHLKGKVLEYELILNRSGLPNDLSLDRLERLWICEKHRADMGRNWRPRRTCQYPLHSGPKKQLKTRNAVSPDMSREIKIIYGNHVPTGSRKSDCKCIVDILFLFFIVSHGEQQ